MVEPIKTIVNFLFKNLISITIDVTQTAVDVNEKAMAVPRDRPL